MKFVAKTLYGLETELEKELVSLGAGSVKAVNRAVIFEGDKGLLYKANYCSRIALSILMPVAEFRIRSKEDLYREGMRIRWDRYMGDDVTFSIVPVVNSPHFSHSGYPALILKDAVADFFRNKTGKRPSVDTSDPALIINLHISNDTVTVSLDSSVIPLYKRGYRKEQSEAPLNEVLAAGIISISGWNGSTDIIDPMCGSGTFAIEAGLIARKIPPGKFRKHFGFMRWNDFDEELFATIKAGSESYAPATGINIIASDISEKAVSQARTNVTEAGLADLISPEVADFKDRRSETGNETLFMNPPYGLRLSPDETDQLYTMIGSTLKHNFPGCRAWLITPNRESLKFVGLKPAKKHILFNGAIECTLFKYELYPGSRKTAVK